MDDLNGLDWSANPANGQKPNYQPSAFSTLRPTPPSSGRISPLQRSTSPNVAIKSPSSATDSFSNLVTFGANASNKNLSLDQQKKKLAELKLQQTVGSDKKVQNQYAGGDDHFWNNLGSGRSTPLAQTSATQPKETDVGEDDFLAVFNAVQPTGSKPKVTVQEQTQLPPVNGLMIEDDDDDDPFGLSDLRQKYATERNSQQRSQQTHGNDDDDDDVLGLLGQPVGKIPTEANLALPERYPTNGHPQDKAMAELVDMGFPIEKAKLALQSTESGLDVQAAVSWLLNQAHSEARDKSRNRSEDASMSRAAPNARPRETSSQRDSRSSTPFSDTGKAANDFGNTLMKSAGSFWKQAKKQAQQAMQDFNSDSDSNQPKWMKGAQSETRPSQSPSLVPDKQSARRTETKIAQDVTDEALMLETSRPEKLSTVSRPQQVQRRTSDFGLKGESSRDRSPAFPQRSRIDIKPQADAISLPSQHTAQARAALSRKAAEQEASQAYVSSARRRKPAMDVVQSTENEATSKDSRSKDKTQSTQATAKSTPVAIKSASRPPPPRREVPPVTAISLKASHADREAGNDHFKRGDYASAHQSYVKSLSYLPASHPITIILLTNKALTALRIGEPRQAVIDADAVIALIGISKGESETIDLNNGEQPKRMRDYYGKALLRKAEALEHMEKWAEAAAIWREAVESGHGGSTAIQGRARAENAAKPQTRKQQSTPNRKPALAAQRKPTSNVGAAAEAAAISRLRAQNAAAEKLDDEKFALSDAVDAKLNAWRNGKQDNLRALLGSLDAVLWAEAGWKKISMADLVLPNKVKIQYMKGIAKVHPDKIPNNATTEQRMIAGAVFSTLNEAWDKFKQENGL